MEGEYSPGLENVIAASTKISYLDTENGKILVRGYDLVELAQKVSYADASYLLINEKLPTEAERSSFTSMLKNAYALPGELYSVLGSMPRGTSVMDALRTGISFLAGYEDAGMLHDSSRRANVEKGVRILAKAPAIAANAYRALNGLPFVKPKGSLDYLDNFLWMIYGTEPDAKSREIFDTILTCYIEHEMPNSTFAARVISSTFSDIYGAVVGAAASLEGPLHGGANEMAIRMLLEIQKLGGASVTEEYVMGKLARKEKIMGFGHRVWMDRQDPRARLLEGYIPNVVANRPDGRELYAIYEAVAKVLLREKKIYSNVDYPTSLLLYLLGIPIPLYTPVFFCSRISGLVAHVAEQHENNRLFRPRVIYEGPGNLHP